uniref:Uncharacterized protein n=1 Tax=Arundo donax TaxID=35708 RepID=A0A0A9D1H4_ARUDO
MDGAGYGPATGAASAAGRSSGGARRPESRTGRRRMGAAGWSARRSTRTPRMATTAAT